MSRQFAAELNYSKFLHWCDGPKAACGMTLDTYGAVYGYEAEAVDCPRCLRVMEATA